MLDARYHYAADATAEIINLHCDPSLSKPEQFSRIVYTILAAMEAAYACETVVPRLTPSEN